MSDNSESKITDKERVDFLEKGGVFTLEKYCDKRNGICWPTRFKPTFGWEISRDTVRDVLDAAIRKGL